MTTRPSLDALIHLVRYLIDNESCSVEAAIAKAKVPPEMISWVKTYFSDPIEIVSPSILVDNSLAKTKFCVEPEFGNPENFHRSFQTFLINQRKWSRAAVESLDKNSAEIIRRLPDPRSQVSFATRGLVIGHIQSGKTANMAAIIAKAADRGYRFFIIFSGLYNDLRAQTQKRIDQEIIGSSEVESDYPCVEHPSGTLRRIKLTQAGIAGDFKPNPINDINPDTVKFAIVKKNVRVLSSLLGWLKRASSLDDFPALIIDDEADQATINSNYGKLDDEGNEIDPSATNARIRELVKLFPKCSYIGFTATPFANLLIDKEISEDLYPKDFIASLPEPPGYLGPRQLFGLGMTPTELSLDNPEDPNLDIIREIDPNDLQVISTLDSGSELPDVIDAAIVSFILASCARIERGQEDQHFSMFIHPSYITARQEVMKTVVSRYVEQKLKNFIRGGEKRFPSFHQAVQRLWENDFLKVINALPEGKEKRKSFSDIWRHAERVVDAIEVKSLNYGSEDVTDFTPYHPRRYIVIGGNRLSRGLTIEGLSTSVFLRDTSYYDTLLQMGRWFGYRPGYEDLTRIFVEDSIAENFSDLARVELELREDLKKYSDAKPPLTPSQLAPIIRSHHDMYVTARGKMGAGKRVTPSLSGKIKQTVTFPTDDIKKIEDNISQASKFLTTLGKAFVNSEGYFGWKDVASQKVMLFLQSYNFGDAVEINSASLVSFITEMNLREELRQWDIFLPAGSKREFEWNKSIKTKTLHRSPVTRRSIGVLSSDSDIKKWKQLLQRNSNDPDRGCLMLYVIDGTHESPRGNSFYTGSKKPDIIGLVMIFPMSNKFTGGIYISQDYQ